MWGDSDNEDDQEDEQKEEKGPGAEAKTESELVAKEDNEGMYGIQKGNSRSRRVP